MTEPTYEKGLMMHSQRTYLVKIKYKENENISRIISVLQREHGMPRKTL